jgi:hypothetical protein
MCTQFSSAPSGEGKRLASIREGQDVYGELVLVPIHLVQSIFDACRHQLGRAADLDQYARA